MNPSVAGKYAPITLLWKHVYEGMLLTIFKVNNKVCHRLQTIKCYCFNTCL